MKKLIPLFTFTFALHLSLFAVSISSEKIDTFMHLPDWFPTSVDAEHTFGSDDHTNCSHRTTLDTLAAVESVFDAYHERVFYASEGRSNDWDTAAYGPRPLEPQMMLFTNAVDRGDDCFIYSTWTNAWPRATPDSRRFLEFDNLFSLASWIPSLFARRTGTPWLAKGDTWGRWRDIMFGSSWGPVETDLPEVGWTANTSFRPDLSAWCVPLCYCMTDTVFKTSHSSADGFLYDVLRDLDLNFNALYRIEGGPYPDPVSTNGYLAEWHNSGMWTNSAAAKTSVPMIITNKFPLAGPEVGLTNLTRRLVPDDSFHINIKTNGYRTIEERKRSRMASSLFDFSRNRASTRLESVPYDVVLEGLYSHDRYVACRAIPDESFLPFGVSSFLNTNSFDFGDAPFETARIEVEITCEGLEVAYTNPPTVGYQWNSVLKNDAEVSAKVTYKAFFIETNFVSNASSLLATESRALAMLDRTYELPSSIVVADIPETVIERDTERHFSSHLVATGSTELVIRYFGYPYTVLPEAVYLSDIIQASTPDIEYSTTNVYSQLAHPTVVERRLTGGGVGADGGLRFGYYGDQLPSRQFTVAHLKQCLFEEFGDYWWTLPSGLSIEYIRVIDPEGVSREINVGIMTDIGYLLYNTRVTPFDILPFTAPRLTVEGWVNVYREARVFIGGVPSFGTLDRMYPWYGPGPYGYAEGTVGSSRILFAEEVLSFLENGGFDYPSVEWSDDPISLPFRANRAELDNRGFAWDSYHRIAISQPSGGVGSGLSQRVYDETYGPLRAKVDAEFRSRIGGSYSSAEDLIPVDLTMAHYDDVLISGITFSVNDSTIDNLTFSMQGPSPEDIVVMDGDGTELSNDAILVLITLSITPDVRNVVYPQSGFRKRPVAVDGRLSPVIVTDWNWKSLK